MQITSDHIKILLARVLVRQTVMLYLTFLTLLDKHILCSTFYKFLDGSGIQDCLVARRQWQILHAGCGNSGFDGWDSWLKDASCRRWRWRWRWMDGCMMMHVYKIIYMIVNELMNESHTHIIGWRERGTHHRLPGEPRIFSLLRWGCTVLCMSISPVARTHISHNQIRTQHNATKLGDMMRYVSCFLGHAWPNPSRRRVFLVTWMLGSFLLSRLRYWQLCHCDCADAGSEETDTIRNDCTIFRTYKPVRSRKEKKLLKSSSCHQVMTSVFSWWFKTQHPAWYVVLLVTAFIWQAACRDSASLKWCCMDAGEPWHNFASRYPGAHHSSPCPT